MQQISPGEFIEWETEVYFCKFFAPFLSISLLTNSAMVDLALDFDDHDFNDHDNDDHDIGDDDYVDDDGDGVDSYQWFIRDVVG